MPRDSGLEAFVAATRFGMGPAPGDLATIAAQGPRSWLLGQLQRPDAKTARALAKLPSTGSRLGQMAAMRGPENADRKALREAGREAFRVEQGAHLVAAASSGSPYRERLVAFWSNHFAVSTSRGVITAVVGAYEREVVRANLDGTFADMLVASVRHPAMQAYLDNYKSIGPASRAGTRSGRGLNENHAREILELHTLGVDGGYRQADVEALAHILTGWTIARGEGGRTRQMLSGPATAGFQFDPRRHQPGNKTLLGRRYGEGFDEGVRALRELATHDATARFVATKLVRHFVSDTPPRAAVDQVARAFRESGGDLPAVHRALVLLDAPFEQPLTKVKSPRDLVISTARAVGQAEAAEPMLAALRYLGQLPFQAPSPQGWPDVAEAWLGPEAILGRLDWVREVSRTVVVPKDLRQFADQILGPTLTPSTASALASSTGPDALALLLASPEFQRR